MEILDDDFSQPTAEVLTDKEVFTLVWIHPKRVMRFILRQNYNKYLYGLVALLGIANVLGNYNTSIASNVPILATLAMIIIFGAFLGWITTYIYAALLRWTGRWLGGDASIEELFKTMVYTSMPTIATLPFFFLGVSLLGRRFFVDDDTIFVGETWEMVVYYGINIGLLILGIWTFVLNISGVSEAQGFSIGRAILNYIIPIFAIIIVVFVVVLTIYPFIF